MKLSFSNNSSKAKATSRPNLFSSEEPAAVSTSSGPQFLTEFDPTKPLNSEPDRPVIAPIPNSDYIRRFKPSLPTADDDPSQFCEQTQFVLDTNNSADDPSGLKYGLSVRSNKEKDENGKHEEKETARKKIDDRQRFKEDMQKLPEPNEDEFRMLPIDKYGAALLRGLGWSEGKGLGRNRDKEDTPIVDIQRRGGSFGLGFDPSASHLKKKRGGEWTLQPNNNNNNNNNLERERTSRSTSRREDNNDNNSVERERDGDRDDRRIKKVAERESSSRRRKEEERERERSTSSRRRIDEDKNKERERERESKEVVRWLRSHIRVRIISKDIKRGKYYLKKGEILDVVGPTTCDISMDGNGELVQGVEQEMLETALPKNGGTVLVLYGKHKGVLGNLMEKDSERETGVVRDADSHQLINVKLEQIAEFVGDVDAYLDY